jgi:hypothetical protein
VLAEGAGKRHAGFVSAVDGVAGLAPGDGVLALEAAGPDRAELANPGREKPEPVSSRAMEAAASEAVLSASRPGSASGDLPDAVLPGVTTGSGAEAPSGLAGTSARPLPCGRSSLGGGAAALGTVTSERWSSGDFARDGGSASDCEEAVSWDDSDAESEAAGEFCAAEEPSAAPFLVLPWMVVVAADGVLKAPAADPDALSALAASVPAAFEPASPASRDFLPDSVWAAFDFRTVLSSSAAASAA